MTTDTFRPIIDPESGEVIAATEEERQEVIELAAQVVIDHERQRPHVARARQILALLMGVGDAYADPGTGWAVMVKPPAPPRRQVVLHALTEHAEALEPLGLAPREVQVTRMEAPGVADLTSKQARAALARVGLTPEQFLAVGIPGDPKIEVVAPEGGQS